MEETRVEIELTGWVFFFYKWYINKKPSPNKFNEVGVTYSKFPISLHPIVFEQFLNAV